MHGRSGLRQARARPSSRSAKAAKRTSRSTASRPTPRAGSSSCARCPAGSRRVPSPVDADPTTTRGLSIPRPSLSPTRRRSSRPPVVRPAVRRPRRPCCRPTRSAPGPAISMTRSFGHFRRMAPSGSPAVSSAASTIASATVAATRHARSGGRYVGRKPSEHRRPAPAGADQVVRAGRARLSARRRSRSTPRAWHRAATSGRCHWCCRRSGTARPG